MFRCADSDASGSLSLARVWKTLKNHLLQISGTVKFVNVTAKGPIAKMLQNPVVKAELQLTFHLPVDTTLPAFKTEGVFIWQASGAKKGETKTFSVAGRLTRRHLVSVVTPGDAAKEPSTTTEKTP